MFLVYHQIIKKGKRKGKRNKRFSTKDCYTKIFNRISCIACNISIILHAKITAISSSKHGSNDVNTISCTPAHYDLSPQEKKRNPSR